MAEPNHARSPFVSIVPLPLSLLPPHPALPSSTEAIPLQGFVEAALSSAEEHLATFKGFESAEQKSSLPSIAKIAVKTSNGWAIRRSLHESKAEKGTATWDEILDAVAYNHSENEATYTPTIKYSHNCINWEIPSDFGEVNGWAIKEVAVYESCHRLPFPLSDRVFPFIIISAVALAGNALTIISIPVDASQPLPGSKQTPHERAKHVFGKYAAIERITFNPSPEGATGPSDTGTIEWLMGTDSDPGGNLPKMMTERAVPSQIAKDVGLCIGWIASKRGK